jgi:protein-S-isoprenylcysteine O-methyltransferase Ste14
VHRWQIAIPIPFFVVVAFSEPMAPETWLLDVACDVAGGALVLAGLWLRLWATGHAERRAPLPKPLPSRLVTTGPFAFMRHPLLIANALISVGVVVLGESGPGLILIAAVLVVVYRAAAAVEETSLTASCGPAYADYCAGVPRVPRVTRELFGAASVPWTVVRAELPMVAGVLLVAVIADLYALFR